MSERWLPIAGFEGRYEVSDQGRVRNRRGHILRPCIHSKGYHQVGLFIPGVATRGRGAPKKVHRLVAGAFVPNPLGLPEVNHIDSDKGNNCASNLEWVTPQQNTAHSIVAGKQHGLANPTRAKKLTPEDVAYMRANYQRGYAGRGGNARKLAAQFGVGTSTFYKIIHRQVWRTPEEAACARSKDADYQVARREKIRAQKAQARVTASENEDAG